MMEKVVYLEGIDPVVLYGINNIHFEFLKKAFPKLRMIGRGDELRVMGDDAEVSRFEEKIQAIVDYYQKYNSLTIEELEELVLENGRGLLKSDTETDDVLVYGNEGRIIKARTVNQIKLVEEYRNNDLLFAIGPAGTGKTYTAIALAVRAWKNREVQRIVLTRPAVEAGEKLGFLPGDVKEKLDPYLQPLYDALNDMIPARKLAGLLEEGIIQIAPLAYMRGRTLSNAFVILDEAQNTTVNQLKMFLTRMGKNAKFIVTGDITQIDLPEKTASGLIVALNLLQNIPGISVVEFDVRDIIRHRLVKYIVEAYSKKKDNN
ncbi:MAG TPA: PhoH family protein [Bacteroidales bacterium]|nr:PhoH family protein [Bacteroidales bacterium]